MEPATLRLRHDDPTPKHVCTCTALVCLAAVFSAPLSSRWSAYARWHLQWFPPPRPSHHAYACRTGGKRHMRSTHKKYLTCIHKQKCRHIIIILHSGFCRCVKNTDLGASVASSSSEYCEAQCWGTERERVIPEAHVGLSPSRTRLSYLLRRQNEKMTCRFVGFLPSGRTSQEDGRALRKAWWLYLQTPWNQNQDGLLRRQSENYFMRKLKKCTCIGNKLKSRSYEHWHSLLI